MTELYETELYETVESLIEKGLVEAYDRNGETRYRLTVEGGKYFACPIKDSDVRRKEP